MKQINCKIMSFLSIIIQWFLGLSIILIWLVKRYFEKPKRKWKIFILDISKQFIGLFIIHIFNVLFSYIFGSKTKTDDCFWYFSSVLIDCTFGILFNWVMLKIIYGIFKLRNIKIKSGDYFKKYIENGIMIVDINYRIYFWQLFVWIFIIILMKITVILIQLNFNNFWKTLGKDVFNYLNLKENSELVFNLIIFPNIMNIIQFVIQDNFLKKKDFRKEDDLILEKYYIQNKLD